MKLLKSESTVQESLEDVWSQVSQFMIQDVGEASYNHWIKPLSGFEFDNDTLTLIAPNRFIRDWIEIHYSQILLKNWKKVLDNLNKVSIIVQENFQKAPHITLTTQPPEEESFVGEVAGAELDERFTFENFVVGKPNELAYAAALRVAESRATQYNPLFLYGGVGLGKTHLMHAIAWKIKELHPDRKVIYLSAEKFMYEFIRSLRYRDTVSFKEQFRSVDVLMIDDVQFVGGKDTTQEELFHTFNALVDQNRQVIISADKSPSDLEGMEERLKSRLGWGLVADIHPTTYELRLGILQSKAEALGSKIPRSVMEFLAFRITSNVRELEGSLNRIVAHATLVGREITLETTQDVLRDLLRSNDKRVTIEDIQRRVCEYYKVRLSDLMSSSRSQSIARPRQIAMYLCKILTTKSLPEIGKKFGGRDHTTVLHAIRKVEELNIADKEFSENLRILQKSLEG